MSDTEEQFNLVPQIDAPMNTFKVVHFSNKSSKYHLTRQVLLDSVLTDNPYCFFYHVLAKNTDEFNEMYGLFACLIPRNQSEAEIFLNVNADALNYIIDYVQTGKIPIDTSKNNPDMIHDLIDLATMFGMPSLVAHVKKCI